MRLLSTLFRARRDGRAAPRRATPPPRLEGLEDRRLLNVSPVFDAAGNFVRFAVLDDGSLIRYDNAGGQVLATSGVRVAHGFRDLSGGVGLDIVYFNGAAVEYDFTGGHVLATSGVLDMSRAYD